MAIDLQNGHVELRAHIGHEIECVGYWGHKDGEFANIALECATCGVVLLDFDHPGWFGELPKEER